MHPVVVPFVLVASFTLAQLPGGVPVFLPYSYRFHDYFPPDIHPVPDESPPAHYAALDSYVKSFNKDDHPLAQTDYVVLLPCVFGSGTESVRFNNSLHFNQHVSLPDGWATPMCVLMLLKRTSTPQPLLCTKSNHAPIRPRTLWCLALPHGYWDIHCPDEGPASTNPSFHIRPPITLHVASVWRTATVCPPFRILYRLDRTRTKLSQPPHSLPNKGR